MKKINFFLFGLMNLLYVTSLSSAGSEGLIEAVVTAATEADSRAAAEQLRRQEEQRRQEEKRLEREEEEEFRRKEEAQRREEEQFAKQQVATDQKREQDARKQARERQLAERKEELKRREREYEEQLKEEERRQEQENRRQRIEARQFGYEQEVRPKPILPKEKDILVERMTCLTTYFLEINEESFISMQEKLVLFLPAAVNYIRNVKISDIGSAGSWLGSKVRGLRESVSPTTPTVAATAPATSSGLKGWLGAKIRGLRQRATPPAPEAPPVPVEQAPPAVEPTPVAGSTPEIPTPDTAAVAAQPIPTPSAAPVAEQSDLKTSTMAWLSSKFQDYKSEITVGFVVASIATAGIAYKLMQKKSNAIRRNILDMITEARLESIQGNVNPNTPYFNFLNKVNHFKLEEARQISISSFRNLNLFSSRPTMEEVLALISDLCNQLETLSGKKPYVDSIIKFLESQAMQHAYLCKTNQLMQGFFKELFKAMDDQANQTAPAVDPEALEEPITRLSYSQEIKRLITGIFRSLEKYGSRKSNNLDANIESFFHKMLQGIQNRQEPPEEAGAKMIPLQTLVESLQLTMYKARLLPVGENFKLKKSYNYYGFLDPQLQEKKLMPLLSTKTDKINFSFLIRKKEERERKGRRRREAREEEEADE